MLFDIQVPSDAAFGKLNFLAGTRNDLVFSLPTAGTPASVANYAYAALAQQAIAAGAPNLTAAYQQ